MFTGIIRDIGVIRPVNEAATRFAIDCHFDPKSLWIGESIACSGVCLTVVKIEKRRQGFFKPAFSRFYVDVSEETKRCTAPHLWRDGANINLERALNAGDSLSGHYVTGHVDGLARVVEREAEGESVRFSLQAPDALAPFIAAKGSVTLDGVSLTVNKVDGQRFWINIIPHTLQETTLGERAPGDQLNLEIDIIARYLERMNHYHAAAAFQH